MRPSRTRLRGPRLPLALDANICSNIDVRWAGQEVVEDGVGADLALPGMRGLLRSVRQAEFAGMIFHEVEARSALNKVPGHSSMPFRWTINPYRGCSHACTYCMGLPDDREGSWPGGSPPARNRDPEEVAGEQLSLL